MSTANLTGALGEVMQTASSPVTRTEDIYGAIVNNNASLNSLLERLHTIKYNVLGAEAQVEKQGVSPKEATSGTLNRIGEAIDHQIDVISKIADVVNQLESL